ncbi:MAG: hypothetical protein K0Q63_191 [Paenibacillus sp.]|jgi:hypothetical protein|nr:hypothetical protein [Paenibacillus sp.]
MVISFKGWMSRMLFLLLFAALLVIASGGYRWLLEVVSPVSPYHKPKGEALKVLQQEPASPEGGNTADRLRWFYWYGE